MLIATVRRAALHYQLTVMSSQARAKDCPWASMAEHDREKLKQKVVVLAQIFFEARWVVIHRDLWKHLLSPDGGDRAVPEQ